MYTPTQVSQMLDLAPSTLRKYANLFGKYLSPSANAPRRKYTDTDIAILQKVCQMRDGGAPLDEIGAGLQVIDLDDIKPAAVDSSLALVPTVAADLDQIHNQLATFDDRYHKDYDDIRSRLQHLEDLQDVLDQAAEIRKLESRIADLESQLEDRQKSSFADWIASIFRRS